MTNDLISIPCALMRGGTSKGPFFLASDLPSDPLVRDRVLLAALGSGHVLQIDGIGGGHPTTSKVAIVDRSARADAHVDYLFAQVRVEEHYVDLTPNCGNMLAAVGPFAIEAGLVPARAPETLVRIFNVNTRKIIEARVPTRDGKVLYTGDRVIPGVPGTGAPISLSFLDAAGSMTGKLLPTGNARDTIEGIEATLIDCAIPMVLFRAEQLGLSGGESAAELNADAELLERLRVLRIHAGRRMGISDAADRVVPKPILISRPAQGGTLRVRYFMPDRCHLTLAATGAVGIATACATPETIAAEMAGRVVLPARVLLEHPQGQMEVTLEKMGESDGVRAGVVRTARRLFDGRVFVRPSVFDLRESSVASSSGRELIASP